MSSRFHGAKDRETPRAQHEQASAVLCVVPGVQGAGPLVPAKSRRGVDHSAATFATITLQRRNKRKAPGWHPRPLDDRSAESPAK